MSGVTTLNEGSPADQGKEKGGFRTHCLNRTHGAGEGVESESSDS